MEFRKRTLDQDEEAYGRVFNGCASLEEYSFGADAKIGEGTFGVVTKATEKVGGRLVALKKLITHNPRDGVSLTVTISQDKDKNELMVLDFRDYHSRNQDFERSSSSECCPPVGYDHQ